MDMRLEGINAVVTGAGSGLGRALSLSLASRGCRVGIADLDLSRAQETLSLVEERGGRGLALQVDVGDPESVRDMAERFYSEWGKVDLLVNNAGVVAVGHVGDIPLEDWHWQFDVNFWGVLYGCHYFIPRMKRQGKGYILNVASSAGLLNLLEMGPYNATKAAVVSLSETLRAELAPSGIGVTVLCPMFFNTRLLETMRYTDDFERQFAHAAFENARMSTEEVAERALRAVEKEKLYCIPQLSGRVYWAIKRATPGLFYGTLAWGNRKPWGRTLLLKMAEWGLLQ
ncbi:MAG: SDR family NAD(P)-dependent oxidoreductase [Candidatus Geothermincolales bacterium]